MVHRKANIGENIKDKRNICVSRFFIYKKKEGKKERAVGWVSWHVNPCRLFYAKSYLYINIICQLSIAI